MHNVTQEDAKKYLEIIAGELDLLVNTRKYTRKL